MGAVAKENKLGFSQLISSSAWQKSINNALKDPKRVMRFTSAIISAVTTNKTLQQCEPRSVLSGALLGESLGLMHSPQAGHYYLVPFNNKNTGEKEAQFQLGYKGYLQLALRSGYYKNIIVTDVKSGEISDYNPFTGDFETTPILDFAEREMTETIGYYAKLIYLNGFEKAIYWTKEQMEIHAKKYSFAYRQGYSSMWASDFDMMAKKTMIRQLISKWGMMSVELQSAVENDFSENDFEQYDEETIITQEDVAPIVDEVIEENTEVEEEQQQVEVEVEEPQQLDLSSL